MSSLIFNVSSEQSFHENIEFNIKIWSKMNILEEFIKYDRPNPCSLF